MLASLAALMRIAIVIPSDPDVNLAYPTSSSLWKPSAFPICHIKHEIRFFRRYSVRQHEAHVVFVQLARRKPPL